MDPGPPQMTVICLWSGRCILQPSSEAEDLYVLVFWRFFVSFKKTLLKDGSMKLKMYVCKS